jgi:hypothetical protein
VTVQFFAEEPADGTILADAFVTEVVVRFDAAANDRFGNPERRWYAASGTKVKTYGWPQLARQEWQRLYSERDVDELLAAERAKVVEEIAVALAALDPIEAALAGQDACLMAAEVARQHREEQR